MNANEGLMRLALVVRWIGYLLAVGIVALAVAINYGTGTDAETFVRVGLIAGSCAGVGWIVSWIIEGFAKPKAT